MAASSFPPYKAMGLGYIRFAAAEPALFRLLFMRDRRGETVEPGWGRMLPYLPMVSESSGLKDRELERIHLEMWIFVHGIAVMQATEYLKLDEAVISELLTHTFNHLKEERPCQPSK